MWKSLIMNLEVLEQKNQQVFSLLSSFSGFYLAGGTALALQIGHRRSVDFDLFSGNKIPSNLIKKVEQIFTRWKVRILVNNSDELTVLVDDIKITFLFYPFPVLEKLIEFKGIKLLPAKEIAVTKAYTIGRRGSFKDYIDIYFILKEKIIILEEIIKMAEKKYGDDFNARLFLEQLIYLEDIQDTEIIFLNQSVTTESLITFFSKQVSQIQL